MVTDMRHCRSELSSKGMEQLAGNLDLWRASSQLLVEGDEPDDRFVGEEKDEEVDCTALDNAPFIFQAFSTVKMLDVCLRACEEGRSSIIAARPGAEGMRVDRVPGGLVLKTVQAGSPEGKIRALSEWHAIRALSDMPASPAFSALLRQITPLTMAWSSDGNTLLQVYPDRGLDLAQVFEKAWFPLEFGTAASAAQREVWISQALLQVARFELLLHKGGLVNMDLKLENLALNRTGVVSVIDPGSTIPVGVETKVPFSLSYSCPQVLRTLARGQAPVKSTFQQAWWGLGVVLYVLLKGSGGEVEEELPWSEESAAELLRGQSYQTPRKVIQALLEDEELQSMQYPCNAVAEVLKALWGVPAVRGPGTTSSSSSDSPDPQGERVVQALEAWQQQAMTKVEGDPTTGPSFDPCTDEGVLEALAGVPTSAYMSRSSSCDELGSGAAYSGRMWFQEPLETVDFWVVQLNPLEAWHTLKEGQQEGDVISRLWLMQQKFDGVANLPLDKRQQLEHMESQALVAANRSYLDSMAHQPLLSPSSSADGCNDKPLEQQHLLEQAVQSAMAVWCSSWVQLLVETVRAIEDQLVVNMQEASSTTDAGSSWAAETAQPTAQCPWVDPGKLLLPAEVLLDGQCSAEDVLALPGTAAFFAAEAAVAAGGDVRHDLCRWHREAQLLREVPNWRLHNLQPSISSSDNSSEAIIISNDDTNSSSKSSSSHSNSSSSSSCSLAMAGQADAAAPTPAPAPPTRLHLLQHAACETDCCMPQTPVCEEQELAHGEQTPPVLLAPTAVDEILTTVNPVKWRQAAVFVQHALGSKLLAAGGSASAAAAAAAFVAIGPSAHSPNKLEEPPGGALADNGATAATSRCSLEVQTVGALADNGATAATSRCSLEVQTVGALAGNGATTATSRCSLEVQTVGALAGNGATAATSCCNLEEQTVGALAGTLATAVNSPCNFEQLPGVSLACMGPAAVSSPCNSEQHAGKALACMGATAAASPRKSEQHMGGTVATEVANTAASPCNLGQLVGFALAMEGPAAAFSPRKPEQLTGGALASKGPTTATSPCNLEQRTGGDLACMGPVSCPLKLEEQMGAALAGSQPTAAASPSNLEQPEGDLDQREEGLEVAAAAAADQAVQIKDSELEAANRETHHKQQALAAAEQALRDKDELLAATQLEVAAQAAAVQDVNNQLELLQQQADATAAALVAQEAESAAKEAALVTCRADLAAAQQQLTEATGSVSALQEQLAPMDQDKDELLQQLSAATSAGFALQQKLAALEMEKGELQQQLTEAIESGSALQGQLAALQIKKDKLRQQLNAAASAGVKLQQQLAAQEQEKGELRQQLNAAASAGVELQQQLTALQTDKIELQQQLNEAVESRSELQGQVAALQMEKGGLQQQLNEAIESRSELQQQLAALEQDKGKLHQQLTEAASAGVELQQQLAAQEVEKVQLQQQLHAAASAGVKLQQQLAAQEQEKGGLKQQLHAMEAKAAAASEQLQTANVKLGQQDNQLAALSAQSTAQQAALATRDAELVTMRQQLLAMAGQLKVKDKQLQEQQQKLSDASEQLATAADQLKVKDKQMQDQQQQLNDVSEQLLAANKAAEDKGVDLKGVQGGRQALEAELSCLGADVAALRDELAAAVDLIPVKSQRQVEGDTAAAAAAAAAGQLAQPQQAVVQGTKHVVLIAPLPAPAAEASADSICTDLRICCGKARTQVGVLADAIKAWKEGRWAGQWDVQQADKEIIDSITTSDTQKQPAAKKEASKVLLQRGWAAVRGQASSASTAAEQPAAQAAKPYKRAPLWKLPKRLQRWAQSCRRPARAAAAESAAGAAQLAAPAAEPVTGAAQLAAPAAKSATQAMTSAAAPAAPAPAAEMLAAEPAAPAAELATEPAVASSAPVTLPCMPGALTQPVARALQVAREPQQQQQQQRKCGVQAVAATGQKQQQHTKDRRGLRGLAGRVLRAVGWAAGAGTAYNALKDRLAHG